MPTLETLKDHYGNYRQHTASKLTFFNPQRLAEHILNIAGDRWYQPKLRVLDFGGADGSLSIAVAEKFLASAREHNRNAVDIDVIDYSQQPKQPANGSIFIRQLASLEEAEMESYDLVIASAVMEHIPDPKSDYQRLFRAMRSGSCFYARTPWIAPVLKIVERLGIESDFTYPAHVHDLGKQFWEGLTERLGLDPSEIRLRHSHPSIVETKFSEAPLRTLVSRPRST